MRIGYTMGGAGVLAAGLVLGLFVMAGGKSSSSHLSAAAILARARRVALATTVFRYRERYNATDIYSIDGSRSRRWHRLRAVESVGPPDRLSSIGFYRTDSHGRGVLPNLRGTIQYVTVGPYTAQRRGRGRWTCEKDDAATSGPRGSYSNPIGPLWFPSRTTASRAHVRKVGRHRLWVVSTKEVKGSAGPHGLPDVYLAARYWIDPRTYKVRRMVTVGTLRQRVSGDISNMGSTTVTITRYGGRVPTIHLPPGVCREAS